MEVELVPRSWGNKYRNRSIQFGACMVMSSARFRPKRERALVRPSSNQKLQTHSFVREGAPQ
jgi:hypothetical protein